MRARIVSEVTLDTGWPLRSWGQRDTMLLGFLGFLSVTCFDLWTCQNFGDYTLYRVIIKFNNQPFR